MGECIIDSGYTDDGAFDTEQFANTRAINFAHIVPHRYGHTNNITVLVSGIKEEQKDYLAGMIATSISILLIFKYLGPARVGGMSGKMKPLPPIPENSSCEGNEPSQHKEDLAEWQTLHKKKIRRLNLARYSVIVTGILLVLSAVCMSIYGYV
jgi:hypothetical protein